MNNQLTIFYDANCPLCNLEMQKLKSVDSNNRIILVNLHQEDFNIVYPNIDSSSAMKILHGIYKGETLHALDVTHKAWTLVGKGALVAPLQFPIIKQLAHGIYLLLAKYRHLISNFLYKRLRIGENNCIEGVCYEKPNTSNSRSK